MKEGANLLGHRLHPILIVFPLGLLTTGTVFDLIYAFRGGATPAIVAYWMIAAGLVGGAAAAIVGLIDWLAVPKDTRARTVGALHGIINAIVMVLFVASLFIRYPQPLYTGFVPPVLSVIGILFGLVGGWLGGEMVERLGIGVHAGANPNAPNSLLTDKPYTESMGKTTTSSRTA